MIDFRRTHSEKRNSQPLGGSPNKNVCQSGQTKVLSLPVTQTRLFFMLFVSIAALPLFIHAQWITGVIVNAILIFAYLKMGFRPALFLAFIPSMAALVSGLLPLAMSPIIPFVISANVILLLVFHLFGTFNFFVKLTVAALLKCLFLYGSTHIIVPYFLPKMFIPSVMLMMGLNQFITAMVGGVVAFMVMEGLSSYENKYFR